ncbi:hypothetical protein [Endozoicomonas sp. SCSIO W0465]|uniref:hypothetical protein n=1 Tax=Endozoicomonas sp. SCSIO W0465 TaxID=2918516 RepID=UPI0020755B99|nr:hypothetical protein [Endozoicomonas sp. SCSIO W0465]USE37080.1 hypothetical protein MJO57_02285 [Endozoicomonas sp. SCSIO W0465]
MDLHGSDAARIGHQRVAPFSVQPENSQIKAGRNIKVHFDPFGSTVRPVPPDTEPLERSASEYHIAIVRESISGSYPETGRRASPEFFICLEKIRSLLAGPLTEESLKKIDALYNRINECDFFTAELETMNDLKKRISSRFSYYVEQQKKALVDQLKTCFTMDSSGGADRFYDQFTCNIKRLFSELTPVMQELLYDVGLTILLNELDPSVISHLKDQLYKNVSPDYRVSHQSPDVLSQLKEGVHTAKMIVRRQGKHRPAVMQNYLERLSSLIGRSVSMSESDCRLHRHTLELIDSVMIDALEIRSGSDADNRWHRMLFEAVLNTRFASGFMATYQHRISSLPPQEWGLEQLERLVPLIRQSGQVIAYCSREFLSLLAKMDCTDNEQPVGTAETAASHYDEDDDCRAVECDEAPSEAEKSLTEDVRKKELEKFLRVVALEASGVFCLANYDRSYSDWHVVVEMLFGKQAFTSPHARKAIQLLVDLSEGGVKTANFHFFDTTGNKAKAEKRLEQVMNRIREKQPDKIDIRQNGHSIKVSIQLWKDGQICYTCNVPAVTESGIPFESMAMAVQILCGKELMKHLYSYHGRALEFRYYRPTQLVAP